MDYTYISNGGIGQVGGCSTYTLFRLYFVKYKVGSIVYSKPKALKGVIEKIVIKKIRLFPERENSLQSVCKICTFPPLYIDTLNAYHNEEDLVGPEDAVDLVDQYLARQRVLVEKAALNDC